MPTDAELEQLYAHHRENEDRYAWMAELKAKWDAMPREEQLARVAFKRHARLHGITVQDVGPAEWTRLKQAFVAKHQALAWLRRAS